MTKRKPGPRRPEWWKESTPRSHAKYKTFAEGFAARAEDEQKKIDMQNEIAKTMRGETRCSTRP